MNTIDLALTKRKNLYGSLVEGIALRQFDIRKDGIRDCLNSFGSISHRLEEIVTIRGITFINDSRATNVNACWYALESLNQPIIWIAGGLDNNNNYSMLQDLAKQKVKALVCIGVNNYRLIEFFKNDIEIIIETPDIHSAVNISYNIGVPGDTVLLSPACASFDRFESYADRGDQFRKAVIDL